MADNKQIKNSKLSRNRFADDLKYLDTDVKTSIKLNDRIEAMLTKIFGERGRKFGNRSPFKIILNAAKELQKLNFFWIAESVNEHNILLAENPQSVQGIAAANGFNRHRGQSASGRVKLQILSTLVQESGFTSISIDNRAKLKHQANGLEYFVNLRNDQYTVNYAGGITVELDVMQGQIQTVQHIGDGNELQIFKLESQKIIAENSIKITTSSGIELINKGLFRELTPNDNAYILRNGFDNTVTVHFGANGVGYKPSLGEVINIEYLECEGSLGNALENSEFKIVSGFKIDGQDYDISKYSKLSAKYDFIDGYDGDSIDVTRLNVGAQSSTNVIATPDQVRSYLRAYPGYVASEVWREPGTNIIHALLTPNLSMLASSTSYFDITEPQFTITEQDKQLIQLAIFNDKRNVLVSNIDFKDYTLARYSAFVFVKLSSNTLITENLRNEIQSLMSDILVQSWSEHVRILHKSDFISILTDSIEEIISVDIKFVHGDNTTDDQYIDEIGDIDTRAKELTNSTILTNAQDQYNYVIPILKPVLYNGVQLNNAVKILVENTVQSATDTNPTTWVEI